mmetsp:Transcript_23308/g.68453  ORF Transcript_23308/g.68453 Transcript_23308/m.68453 type:complete len:224 (-) Transcript_23308:276-947(-)
MMAFVVAIAGMMLPAISLTSHRDWRGMPKMVARRLDAAVTKSSACASSLSNVRPPTSAGRSSRITRTASMKTAAFSSTVHARCSTSARRAASGGSSSPSTMAVGGLRSFHSASIASSRRTSASKTASNTRRAKSVAASPSARVRATAAGGGASAAGAPAAPPSVAASPSALPSAVSTRSVSSPPKSFLKSSSLAHAMQWTGLSGWFRIVQIGYDFFGGGGLHS